MQQQAAKLEIKKIYLKDSSWEAPHSPEIFKHKWKPEVNVEIRNQAKPLEENFVEIIVHIHITCRNEKKVAYIIELEQAGVFQFENILDDDKARIFSVVCPNILFPYARESLDNMIVRGGFSALMLAPINFDALYAQAQQKKEQQVTH